MLSTARGFASRSHSHDQFASDVLVEAKALVVFDAHPVLDSIRVPVLLTGGDQDFYFPRRLIEEAARLIPDCTLKMDEGKGHLGACTSSQLAPDILEFVHRKQTAAT